MTAEGDNSVLMQKVSKELLAAVSAGKVKYAKPAKRTYDLCKFEDLVALIKAREAINVITLGMNLNSKLKSGKQLFDVWMKEESDLIQATSKSYGERVCLDQMVLEIQKGGESK